MFCISAFPTCRNGIEVIEEADFNNGVFDCSDNSDEPIELCEHNHDKVKVTFEKDIFGGKVGYNYNCDLMVVELGLILNVRNVE